MPNIRDRISIFLTMLSLLLRFPAEGQQHTLPADSLYTNPVIFADYSDPDVIRSGEYYYLTASSFNCVPALPILRSRDLVHWEIVAYAAARLPSPDFDTPLHGNGVWAPSLREHNGEYWIFYGDPDRGIYMTKAKRMEGPWEPLTLVHAAKGWIDPCPFWDDDGSAYLVHAWAKSRAGFNSILTVNRMSPDGRSLLDTGRTVFDGHAHHPTIEGPKFYKRNGFYYIFAPAGGVAAGWQTVLRSKHVFGPYEDRIVMAQGSTPVNGPHQGAWIETPTGESWFMHFQERQPYGRIVHLQPMRWQNDWPVIGSVMEGMMTGEPVLRWKKPITGIASPDGVQLQTTDEFDEPALGLQWQWHANPHASWYSLSVHPGSLRLYAAPSPDSMANFYDVPSLLLQKFPAERFSATVKIAADSLGEGQTAGLLIMGLDYARLSISRDRGRLVVALRTCTDAHKSPPETVNAERQWEGSSLVLRAVVDSGGVCRFSFSGDGIAYTPIGEPFQAREGKWIGAKAGVFCLGGENHSGTGFVELDWFRILPMSTPTW